MTEMQNHDASMRTEIADAVGRLLADHCPPGRVRAIEKGDDRSELWRTLEASGFIDAMAPEAVGGAGLSLAVAAPVIELSGRYGVPVPLAETMVLRGILCGDGVGQAGKSLAFGGQAVIEQNTLRCDRVVNGRTADHVVVDHQGEVRILPRGMSDEPGSGRALACEMHWSLDEWRTGIPAATEINLRDAQALTHALQMAGALEAVLERTLAYANDRTQFGRPIGKFQAIQHQLSVMAEEVFAAQMAAELAAMTGFTDTARIAVAKARTSQAASQVTGLAHAIHGAIGFTAEYDLQLLTRRLHCWRQAAGSEGFWQVEIGQAVVAGGSTLDMLRRISEPA